MVWRCFWQHSIALSWSQCALLRDCACWHSGEEAADPGFQIHVSFLPANHSGGRLGGQSTYTTVPCRSRKTNRSSRISAGRRSLYWSLPQSTSTEMYRQERAYQLRSRLLLSGGAGQQQVSGWLHWCWWTFCTVEACKAMPEAVLLCVIKIVNRPKL